MADSEFDARAMASAILAKVRAAHLVEADARAQLPDTERVRFRDEDRSIRSVEAMLLTADDWAKLEKSDIPYRRWYWTFLLPAYTLPDGYCTCTYIIP